MITCALVNKSGSSPLGNWTGRTIPRIGELLVVRQEGKGWGDVLKVVNVVNYTDGVRLHVKYHGTEQHL